MLAFVGKNRRLQSPLTLFMLNIVIFSTPKISLKRSSLMMLESEEEERHGPGISLEKTLFEA